MHDTRNIFQHKNHFGHHSWCSLTFIFARIFKSPTKDAPEGAAPSKSRLLKTFNTSCCAPIFIYVAVIPAPRKLQPFKNECSPFFSPSPALYRASHWCTMHETHFKTTKNHLSGILLLVFTDVYFYTDSQVDHQTGTLQRAPRQENRESLKHSTLHAVLRS